MARKKGLRRLGEVALRLVPERRNVVSDLVAGLTFAVVSVLKAMAHALLATVNPVLGI
jgi:MFS superfamily sulfate permease-like transporter